MSGDGRRLYDWWGRHAGLYRVVDLLSGPIRRRAVEALDLRGGERVLDVGCGPGATLPELVAAVGRDGEVIGLDYNAAMVRRASGRVEDRAGATVVRADAGSLPLRDDRVDAAVASLALSAMPGAEDAVAAVRRVLVPGGRFAVVDGSVPRGGVVGGALSALYRRVANWQGHDVVALLESEFPSVAVVETYDAGLSFVALAEFAEDPPA